MKKNQRLWLKIALAVIALIVAGSAAAAIWFTSVKLPAIVRKKIETAVHDNCSTCKLDIGEITTPLFPLGQINLFSIKFKSGSPGGQEVSATVDQLSVRVDLSDSSETNIHLSSLEIYEPRVLMTDGDATEKASKPKADSGPEILFTLDQTILKNGSFNYLRNTHGTSAELHVHQIAMTLDRITTDKSYNDKLVDGSATAQIEKTGAIELKVKVAPFAKALMLNVDFRVRDQNLADLTTFLKPNAGVELNGMLTRGHSVIVVRDRKESARVWAEYHGLKVKLDKTWDRSGFEAFFISLGADLTMTDDNSDRLTADQTRTVEYERKPGQSIMGFLVQGMKEASIKVAQAKKTKASR